MGQAKSVCHEQIIGEYFIAQVCKDEAEDDENAYKSENTEETLEDEVNENDIKTENIEESLEPVEVNIAG
jgi:hypothetical protein